MPRHFLKAALGLEREATPSNENLDAAPASLSNTVPLASEPAAPAAPSADDIAAKAAEAELELARTVAKRMGWAPKEEWTRDPAKWVDAPEFLESTPRALKEAQERARRASQAAEAVIEAERAKARETAEAQVRTAATAQDPDAAAEAAKRLAANSGPSPRAQAWMAERPFLREDPDALQMAVSIANRGAVAGLSEEEQLEAADMALRKRFPEHFMFEERKAPEPPPKPNGEARLSDLPKPPVVQPGTRTGPTTPSNGEKGFKDLPASVRADYERHFAKRFANLGLKPEEAQKRYATSYWKDQEE